MYFQFNLLSPRLILLLLLVIFSTNQRLEGQDDLSDFLLADPDDAEKLTSNYIMPLTKGLGYAANSGWYQTAKPHAMGFDLIATLSAAYIPSKASFTQFIENQYKDLELLSPTDSKVPTVFGSEDVYPQYRIPSTGDTFDGPSGNSLEDEFGYEAVLFPMVQLGVGVIPNTDVKVRFMPLLEFDDDFEAGMWGVGILHRLNDYFPSGDELLIDLSLFAGYTRVRTEIQISETFPGDDQRGAQGLNAWTVEGLISYDLSVLTFYGGIGYNEIRADLDLLGTYEVGSEILVDPIATNDTYHGLKATLGMRIKLAVFSLHGQYTFNEYNLATVGFGFDVN